jgi:hypothetical protein
MYYRDANGIEHESYTAACIYYGADTPESLAAEAQAEYDDFLDYCNEFDYFPAEWFPDLYAFSTEAMKAENDARYAFNAKWAAYEYDNEIPF